MFEQRLKNIIGPYSMADILNLSLERSTENVQIKSFIRFNKHLSIFSPRKNEFSTTRIIDEVIMNAKHLIDFRHLLNMLPRTEPH